MIQNSITGQNRRYYTHEGPIKIISISAVKIIIAEQEIEFSGCEEK
jgi:hypothetical protein